MATTEGVVFLLFRKELENPLPPPVPLGLAPLNTDERIALETFLLRNPDPTPAPAPSMKKLFGILMSERARA